MSPAVTRMPVAHWRAEPRLPGPEPVIVTVFSREFRVTVPGVSSFSVHTSGGVQVSLFLATAERPP